MTLKATDKRPATPRGTAFAPSSSQEARDLVRLRQAELIADEAKADSAKPAKSEAAK
jgi:hypothetical protein